MKDPRNPTFLDLGERSAIAAACVSRAFTELLSAFNRKLGEISGDRVCMTSYGHANLFLEEQWQLMGALEALNGMLLFGLTTAFLFSLIQKVWPLGSRGRHREA
jgi:hypothetical protein